MVKPVFRKKSIGTKVSEEEYAQLEALAGGRAMSEWVREVLLRELDGRQARPADETVLAEVLALRTILLNAFYRLAQGEKLMAEDMRAIIDWADATFAYVWNAESEIQTAAAVTYTYDGDGNRLEKSSGKIYWYGAGTEIINESDLSGNMTYAYVFFGGKRIAYHDASNNVYYYAEDDLGSTRTIVAAGQTSPCYEADFYPYGGERDVTNSCAQNYKFEGKERDAETGNDDFGARYYESSLGRWLSNDWSAVPAAVPYANLANPQTLNLYAMVSDNPETFADLDGHQVIGSFANTADGWEGDRWESSTQPDAPEVATCDGCYTTDQLVAAGAMQSDDKAQQRVSFSTLLANYPGHDAYPTDPTAPNSIWSLIGGNAAMNAWTADADGNQVLSNTCAIRMSYDLNQSGLTIPQGKRTVSGADGKQYFLRVADLQKFLTSALGQPQRLAGGSFAGPSGSTGIISFNIPFRDATGHFTLWNRNNVADPKEPYQSWPAPTSTLFWEIK